MNRYLILGREALFGIVISSIIGYVFYKSVLISIIFSFVGLSFALFNKKSRIKREKQKLLESFKELLNSIYSVLLSGKSFRNSLEQSIIEAKNMNANDPLIVYLYKLQIDIQIGTSEVRAWRKFSEEIDIEACYEFVDVLEETYAVGGQITKVIHRTCQILSDKIDLLLELDLMLSAKKFEFRIMMGAPIVLLAILSSSSGGYMEVLYMTFYGRLVMTGVLFAMVVAYIIGKYITQIEL